MPKKHDGPSHDRARSMWSGGPSLVVRSVFCARRLGTMLVDNKWVPHRRISAAYPRFGTPERSQNEITPCGACARGSLPLAARAMEAKTLQAGQVVLYAHAYTRLFWSTGGELVIPRFGSKMPSHIGQTYKM